MYNFKKIFGLAGSVIVFTGLAYGQQATCTAPTAVTNIIRAEGTAEQVAALQFVCTSAAGQAGGATLNVQAFLSPALPVTSRVIVSGTGQTEAILTVTNSSTAAQTQILGTVSGSTINFSGATPSGALLAGGTLTFLIQNVRVNASSLTVGSGVPPAVSETVFVSGPAVVPVALASTTVAFAQNGLAATRVNSSFNVATAGAFPNVTIPANATATGNSFVICNANSPLLDTFGTASTGNFGGRSLAGVVEVNENFAQAFKTAADEADQVPIGNNTAIAGQTTTASNAVISTRIRLTFNGAPTGATIAIPVGPITSRQGGAQITLVNSDTGTTVQTSDNLAGENGLPLRAVTISGGTGTATYSVTTDDLTNLDKFEIPVFIINTANGITASTTPLSVSVSLAPQGSTSVPNFVATSSTAPVTLSSFNLCTTSLLFPFVTNQLGFDTGIAIANTSTDPFAARGAAPQAGTCTMNFYGAGAPSPANVTSPNIPTGTVFTQVLSGVAAGFQGYMIAQCQFQFAHGFAFITDGVGANGGLSQGYLAGVIPDTNQKVRSADPLSAALPGTGETLGN